MKAPGFWYRPVGFIAFLLLPFSLLFRLGGCVRHSLATPYRAQISVICVGNIVAGGAGKTPTAIVLATFLKQQGANPVFVTRGYGGSECGPLRVDLSKHTAQQVGDEALLLAAHAPVFIGRNRTGVIKAAEAYASHIIMDDGLQNPTVEPSHAFLVIDGAIGLGNSQIIPAGPLRETLDCALKRVNAVIMIGTDATALRSRITVPILNAHIHSALLPDFPRHEKFLAFAGIGRPEKFYQTCRREGLHLVETKDFPDHYTFNARELFDLEKTAASQSARLLTTEKDWVRLPQDWQSKVLTLPIKLLFDDEGAIRKLIA